MPQTAERLLDLLGGADEHVGELDRLLHRRLDAVEAKRVSHLLGVVDDVVERGRQTVTVAGVERGAHPPAAREPMDHVVGDAIALVLALANVRRKPGAIGIVDQQVAQQQARPQHVAPDSSSSASRSPSSDLRNGDMVGEHYAPARRPPPGFTTSSRLHHSIFTPSRGCRASLSRQLMPDWARTRSSSTISRSRRTRGSARLRPGDDAVGPRVPAARRDGRQAGGIVSREELCRAVWGRELRARDRSVDVYVSKLRAKLEAAVPTALHPYPPELRLPFPV